MRVSEEHPVDVGANDQGPRTVIRGNSHLNHSLRPLKLWELHDREETNKKAPSEGVFHRGPINKAVVQRGKGVNDGLLIKITNQASIISHRIRKRSLQ